MSSASENQLLVVNTIAINMPICIRINPLTRQWNDHQHWIPSTLFIITQKRLTPHTTCDLFYNTAEWAISLQLDRYLVPKTYRGACIRKIHMYFNITMQRNATSESRPRKRATNICSSTCPHTRHHQQPKPSTTTFSYHAHTEETNVRNHKSKACDLTISFLVPFRNRWQRDMFVEQLWWARRPHRFVRGFVPWPSSARSCNQAYWPRHQSAPSKCNDIASSTTLTIDYELIMTISGLSSTL